MNITIDNEKYKVKVGKVFTAIRRLSDRKSFAVGHDKMSGWDWYSIERARRKRCYFAITPKMVSDWIRKNIQKNS